MKTIVASAIIALSVLMQNAAAETGNAPFCLQTPTGAKCVYDTMGECERARGNTSAVQCITQSNATWNNWIGRSCSGSHGSNVSQPLRSFGSTRT